MNIQQSLLLLAASAPFSANLAAQPNTITEAIKDSTLSLDMRMRYEHVNQDNALKDADALTLRTRLTLETGQFYGFSGLLEFEDSRDLGIDDYNDGLGSKPQYSTIADPNTTELDQAFIRYNYEQFRATVGRQIVALDNQRFVGHVGWRQDRQTFDAAALHWKVATGITLQYIYIDQRNRIFAQERDVDANDHLLNASINTTAGKFTGYAYLLDDNDSNSQVDTYGLRYQGQHEGDQAKFNYQLEYAWQDADNSGGSFDADYYLFELGLAWRAITVRGGLEVLGSDGGNYGFSTPLATLHKFNGWADQFLSTPMQGLEDYYLGVGGNLAGGTWGLTYHWFNTDTDSFDVDDLGDEWDLSYSRTFAKHYEAGIKYAYYTAGSAASGKVDTDKLWLWVSASF